MNSPAPAEAPAKSTVKVVATDPDLAHFTEEVDRTFSLTEARESFWGLEEEFRRLLHSGFVSRFFQAELDKLKSNPAYAGDWRPNQTIVHRGRGWALAVWLFETPRRFIHSTPYHAMYAPLGQQSLHYDIYKLPEGYRNAVFDPSLKLEPAGSGVTCPGGILLLQSDQYAYDFKVEQPLPVLKFTTSAFDTLEWLFAKDSLHAWQANDSELIWTQLRVASYVLGRLAHQSSQEPLELLTTHPHHSVRWAAIQNLGRLSRSAALTKVEAALNDPHPHVRAAAAKTLRQLKSKN
jgi:hypothetical protein